MGFEDNMINSLDRDKSSEHPVITTMYERAQKVLSESAFDPNDFINDPYSKEVVAEDLALVKKLKTKFEIDNAKRIAEVLEAILYLHAELSEWLGSNVVTKRTSEYDDFVNGVDLIAEFNEADITKHLALGVDITFASKAMSSKFDRIKQELDSDDLAHLKYFESHYTKGSIRQIPRIIVGVEKEKVIELAGLWMNGKNVELGNHATKNIILSEIIEQLRTYRDYAQRHGKLNALKSYNDALATLRTLTEQLKGLSKEEREEVSQDRVCQSIREDIRFRFSK